MRNTTIRNQRGKTVSATKLFARNLEDIKWEDLKAFFELRVPENVYLDYKSNSDAQDNKKIAKCLSAMANSRGGLVIIGFKTRRHGSDDIPDTMELVGNPEQVMNSIIDSCICTIAPPLIPEVKFIESLDCSGKGIVIVKVPESDNAPHEYQNSCWERVIDRRSATSEKESRIAVRDIMKLVNKRQACVLERKRITDRAYQRAMTYVSKDIVTAQITCGPLYPTAPTLQFHQLLEHLNRGRDLFTYSGTPFIHGTTTNEGALLQAPGRDSNSFHYEADQFGFTQIVSNVRRQPNPVYSGEKTLSSEIILELLTIALILSNDLMKQNDHPWVGEIQLELTLSGCEGYRPTEISAIRKVFTPISPINDKYFLLTQTFRATDSLNLETITSMMSMYLYSTGLPEAACDTELVQATSKEMLEKKIERYQAAIQKNESRV